MTEREITKYEAMTFQDTLPALHSRGINDSEANGKVLWDWFSKRPAVAVSSDTILQAANELVKQLEYDSPQAKEFNEILIGLSPDEVSALQYFFSVKPLVGLGVLEGFENALLLIGWCRRMGRPIDFPSLEQAMSAFVPRGTGYTAAEAAVMAKATTKQLHWKEAQKTSALDQPYVAGKKNHAYKDPNAPDPNATHWLTGKPKPTEDPRAYTADGRRNWAVPLADEQAAPEPTPLSDSEQAFKRSAEGLLGSGRTHSQNEELLETFNLAVAAQKGWRFVFSEVNRAKADMERVGRRY